MSIELKPIGVVRTDASEIPRHWSVSNVKGTLVIDPQYAAGLRDVAPGQRLVVLFHFDRSPPFTPAYLVQTSGETGRETGLFSTCSPIRPNPLGLSVVEVLAVDGPVVHVTGLDMLDGTPILDLKPHVEAVPG
jgi:tRNA-Thr(GGU) m(6)t(6)A37 methyltransferase TsaA